MPAGSAGQYDGACGLDYRNPDVIEHVRLGITACWIDLALDAFLFQVTEKRLGHRVIPAVASSTHEP